MNSLDSAAPRKGVPPGWLTPALTLGVLSLTIVRPHLPTTIVPVHVAVLSAAAGLGLAALAVALATLGRRRADRPAGHPDGSAAARLGQLALYLSPVILLSVAFPVATHRLAGVESGGTPVTVLLLGAAVTVPWLSQAVCLPVYRALGALTADGSRAEVEQRFLEVWPGLLLKSVPAVLLAAAGLRAALHWSSTAVVTYAALCALHVVFTQALVPGNVRRDRILWAAGWTAYAAGLLAAPAHWYLPPLLGTASQILPVLLRRRFRLPRPRSAPAATDLAAGLLLGSVLWADKVALFVRFGDRFAVQAVFFALLPAVLAYNYYFVLLAPRLNVSVDALRAAMESQPYPRLASRSRALSRDVLVAIQRTGLVGASLTVAVTVATAWAAPDYTAVVAAVSVASWLFMIVTLLSYKLQYIGRRSPALFVGGAHIALTAGILGTTQSLAQAYTWLAALELPLLVVVWLACARQWRHAEYAFFWRHAMAW